MIPDITVDINGKDISYDGNPSLKKPRTTLAYTKEHIEEYVKCSKDWKYFAENYYYLLDVDKGLVIPKIRDYQEKLVTSFIDKRFTIVMASRQCGKSASFEIFIVWSILFQKEKTIAILANKAEQSRDILRKIKQAYELLPKWLQQGVLIWNTGSIKLENRCLVMASSTSSSAIRGKAISSLIVDERAFVPNNIWDDFISSVYPTVSSGKETKVIYVSTPKGLNHFYKDWIDSIDQKNKFNPIRVDWWEVPGRDEKWKEETIANIGQIRFNQEYGLSFLGSIATLVEPKIVSELKYKQNIESSPIFDLLRKDVHRFVNIYVEPIKKHIYSIGVDSCKMTEHNSGDGLAMQVLDITQYPFVQVATFFAKEGFNYLTAPEVAVKLGNYYNSAYMFVENNEVGQEVANIIHYEYEYENVYFEKPTMPGFRTTTKTKRLGCSNLKLLLENNQLIINDFETISQISTFIRKGNSYVAESGYSDDLIMALLASIFFINTTNLDISDIATLQSISNVINENKYNEEEDVPSFGILPDDEYEEKDNIFNW